MVKPMLAGSGAGLVLHYGDRPWRDRSFEPADAVSYRLSIAKLANYRTAPGDRGRRELLPREPGNFPINDQSEIGSATGMRCRTVIQRNRRLGRRAVPLDDEDTYVLIAKLATTEQSANTGPAVKTLPLAEPRQVVPPKSTK